jgi:uncharacterized protein with GYD domain
MAIYISLVKFTREGVMTLKDEGIKRSDKVKATIESLGGKLLDAYYCLGPYDVVAIHEFPDTKAAMKASLLNSALGSMEITTMAAVSRDQWRQLLKDLWPKGK